MGQAPDIVVTALKNAGRALTAAGQPSLTPEYHPAAGAVAGGLSSHMKDSPTNKAEAVKEIVDEMRNEIGDEIERARRGSRIDHGISVPLSPEQRAEIKELVCLGGLTRNQARYRVLTPEQREQFKAQGQASKVRRHAENPRAELMKAWAVNARHKPNGLTGKRDEVVEYTITEQDLDWPTHCPVTGVELHYGGQGGNADRGDGRRRGGRPNSASLDRLDYTRGYVPGNVVIVSNWVNTRKGDATPEQLRQIADFYSRLSTREPWDY